ncbi:MAG: dCMP deaminase family protein [Nanoarchaeota archaeon]|nr:dCMP deaminase family protein [Nanoarchaeota archaeon]
MDLNVPSWDDWFMTMVYFVAAKSKDPRTKIGAVVVGPNKEVRSMGYNGLPRGVNDLPERYKRGEKNFRVVHAEINAILNASRTGTSLEGCVMYTPGLPCDEKGCSVAVIQAGIKEVVLDDNWDGKNADAKRYWRSFEMFDEAGVKVRYHRTKYFPLVKVNDGVICDLV